MYKCHFEFTRRVAWIKTANSDVTCKIIEINIFHVSTVSFTIFVQSELPVRF